MVSLPSQEERGNLNKPDTAVAFARGRESKSGKGKKRAEKKEKLKEKKKKVGDKKKNESR